MTTTLQIIAVAGIGLYIANISSAARVKLAKFIMMLLADWISRFEKVSLWAYKPKKVTIKGSFRLIF